MKNGTIEVKINGQRLDALIKLYMRVIVDFNPATAQEWLLYTGAAVLLRKMEHLSTRARVPRLAMNEQEAFTFCVMWGNAKIDDVYAKEVIRGIIWEIDKVSKQPVCT